ncbi:MAG: CBU_0592 family membrane protein [Actinomycetota bacterium]
METSQLVSIAGAAMVLGAFAALQLKRAQPFGTAYLTFNVVGSACLGVAATLEGLWAFVVLNAVWGLVSVRSLVRVLRGRRSPRPLDRGAVASGADRP